MSESLPHEPPSAAQAPLRGGFSGTDRLEVLAFMGLVAGALPLPAIPTALLRRVRGAVLHDVCASRGLALTPEARTLLSEPSKIARGGAFLATAVFVAKRSLRRLGALGVLPPIAAWFEIYALGLLFERYLVEHRRSRALRIDVAEARKVRAATDRASGLVLSRELRAAPEARRIAIEELRNLSTRVSDAILIGLASGPGYLRRRLETAFDLAMREEPAPAQEQRESQNG
jgi:hypothetical protein